MCAFPKLQKLVWSNIVILDHTNFGNLAILPPPNRVHIYLHHYWSPERRERHMNNFRSAAPALREMFVKPVKAGRKPGHQLRMQTQNEPQTCYFLLHYRSTNKISDFNGTCSKYFPLPSFSVPASPETTTISLSSPVTSALVSFQASSNQCIYLLKILNRSAKPPSNFLWGVTCINPNTQKYGPEKTPYLHTFHAVRMATAPGSIPRPTKNYLGMDPCTFISRITSLKHMTVKVILHLMNSLFTNKLSCMKEPERNYLMVTLSIQKIWE